VCHQRPLMLGHLTCNRDMSFPSPLPKSSVMAASVVAVPSATLVVCRLWLCIATSVVKWPSFGCLTHRLAAARAQPGIKTLVQSQTR
jgi:hypothetical protein